MYLKDVFITLNLTVMTATQLHQNKVWLLVPLVLLTTLFLFFIDEGRYTLQGLFELGNMVAMAFYFIGMLLSTLIIYQLLPAVQSFTKRYAIAAVLGIPIGIALTIGLIYLLRWL